LVIISHPSKSSPAVKAKMGSATKTVKYNKENIVKRLLGMGLPRKSIGFLNGLNIWHCTIFVLAFYEFVKFV